jgi:hypothetical protein
MPWSERDAASKTKKAKSPKRKRQWSHVANSVLKRTGDEGAAVRAANGVVKKSEGKTMRLKSTAKRKAKTSHMPNPTKVGTRAHSQPFKVNGYMTGKKTAKKGGKKGRKAEKKGYMKG